MRGAGPIKHRLLIHEVGRIEHEGTLVEVHSRGGSLFGLKGLIDEFSKRQSLDIRTVYDNKLGASFLGVIFADRNAHDAAEKLDDFLNKRHEFRISGYFSDAVAAAIIVSQERGQSE